MKKFFLPAIIFTLFSISLVVLSIEKVIPSDGSSGWVAIVIYFIVYFFLLRYLKIKHFNNKMTFKAIFKAGVTIALIASVMVALCYYLYCGVINYAGFREFMDTQMEIQKQKLVDNGTYSLRMDSIFKFFGSVKMATIFSAINTLFFGTICSLIIALFLKNKEETDEMGVPLQE